MADVRAVVAGVVVALALSGCTPATDNRTSEEPVPSRSFLAAVADNKPAVLDLVSGLDGAAFVQNLLTHDWPDDGAAAGALFTFDDGSATIIDPDDQEDVDTAALAERVMETVAEQLGTPETWAALTRTAETDHLSPGERNPELIRALAHSITRYIPELAGDYSSSTPAFEQGHGWSDWIVPGRRGGLAPSTRVYAVMSTDDEAAQEFISAAWDYQYASEAAFGNDPKNPLASEHLARVGTVMGLIDYGFYLSTEITGCDETEQANAWYVRMSDAYDFWKGRNAGVDAVGSSPVESFVDSEPCGAETPKPSAPNLTAAYYRILAAAPDLSPTIRTSFPDMFAPDGGLRTYEQLLAQEARGNVRSDIRTAFAYMGTDDSRMTAINGAYGQVVRGLG